MFRRVKAEFKSENDTNTLIWKRSEEDYNKGDRNMMYRFPNQEFPDFAKMKFIGVRDFEKALYYENGKYVGQLSGGLYEIEKKARTRATEVVWFDPGIMSMNWGVSHNLGIPPMTSDGYAVGGSGDMTLQINDPEALITNVVVGKLSFTDSEFKELIFSLIQVSFRDVMKTVSIKEFYSLSKDKFSSRMKTVLGEQFMKYGISLDNIQLLNAAHPENIQSEVDAILRKMREDNLLSSKLEDGMKRELLEDLTIKENQLRELKRNKESLEYDKAMGNIEEKEFNKKIELIEPLITQRNKEIEDLRNKL